MEINFEKYSDGLVPAIIQDASTGKVLMLGFMNQAAIDKSKATGLVTFYSRSKQRLWTKGEESGHFLKLQEMLLDCDADTLLIKANPNGPVCHTGKDTCFSEENKPLFLDQLTATIRQRFEDRSKSSYTADLFNKGINAVAQKVGEEAIEVVIEAKDNDRTRFLNESADLLFHYLVLLQAKECSLEDVIAVLRERHKRD